MNEIEKEIEEMAKKSGGCLYPNNHCGTNGEGKYCWCDARKLCENLIKHYQPKLSKDKMVLNKDEYIENDRLIKLLEEKRLDELKSIHKIFDQTRKETAREILKKGNEYLMQSTDKACAFACFLGIIEHEYGVEIEE